MNYNYSFSGSDCHTFISFMEPNYLREWVQLDSVNTLSISVHEQRSQVRRLGHAGPVGFAGSVRTIAGSIIMTVINENPFNDLIKAAKLQSKFSTRVAKTEIAAYKDLRLPYNYGAIDINYEYQRTNNPATSSYSIPNITTLPPTKIRMRFVSEYHSNNPNRAFQSVNKQETANTDREVERIMELHNVVFISENVVTSVNNMVTELVLQFIASDFIEFTKQKNETEKIEAVKLEEKAEQEVAKEEKNQNNPSPATAPTIEVIAITPPINKPVGTAIDKNAAQANPVATQNPQSGESEAIPEEKQSPDPVAESPSNKEFNEILKLRKDENALNKFQQNKFVDYYDQLDDDEKKQYLESMKNIAQYMNPNSPQYIKNKLKSLAFVETGDNAEKASNDIYRSLFGENINNFNGKLGERFALLENDSNTMEMQKFFNTGEIDKSKATKPLEALNLLSETLLSEDSLAEMFQLNLDDYGNRYLKDIYNVNGYNLLKHGYGKILQDKVGADIFKQNQSGISNDLGSNLNYRYLNTEDLTNFYSESTKSFWHLLLEMPNEYKSTRNELNNEQRNIERIMKDAK